MQVLLVAAKKDLVNTQADLIREAGLVPAVIDVNSLAVQNAAELNYDFVRDEVAALVNVGAELTNVNIIAGRNPLYAQDLSIGGNSFIESVQKRYQVSREEAVGAFRAGGIVDPRSRARPSNPSAEELGIGIEGAVAYLKSSGEAERVDRVLLSGGGARILGSAADAGRAERVPVDIVDPLRRIQFAPESFGADDPRGIGPQLTVAIGLALRKAQEK